MASALVRKAIPVALSDEETSTISPQKVQGLVLVKSPTLLPLRSLGTRERCSLSYCPPPSSHLREQCAERIRYCEYKQVGGEKWKDLHATYNLRAFHGKLCGMEEFEDQQLLIAAGLLCFEDIVAWKFTPIFSYFIPHLLCMRSSHPV